MVVVVALPGSALPSPPQDPFTVRTTSLGVSTRYEAGGFGLPLVSCIAAPGLPMEAQTITETEVDNATRTRTGPTTCRLRLVTDCRCWAEETWTAEPRKKI